MARHTVVVKRKNLRGQERRGRREEMNEAEEGGKRLDDAIRNPNKQRRAQLGKRISEGGKIRVTFIPVWPLLSWRAP
jgi:hypothetical protein